MKFFARLKYRFDLGQSMLTVCNFCLLVITAGDKLAGHFAVSTRTLLLVLVPLALVAVWLLGYLLDVLKFAQRYTDEQNQRNAILTKLSQP